MYSADIYQLELDADLVVLNSCESGAGRLYMGEGVYSLARSFLYAGARNLLFTQWETPDARAKKLSVAFYKSLLQNPAKGYATALTEAKRELISKADSPFYHPGYWSNFVLLGR